MDEETREQKLARAREKQEKAKEVFRNWLVSPAHKEVCTIHYECLKSKLSIVLFSDFTATVKGHIDNEYNSLFLKIPHEVAYEGETYTVTEIADQAFKGITAHIISLPKTLKKIGESSFEEVSGLTSIYIPEGVEYIGKDSFSFCPDLTDVQIPYSIIDIGDRAFMCGSISQIVLPPKMTLTGQNIFAHNPIKQLRVPLGVENLDALIDNLTYVTKVLLPRGFDITNLVGYNIGSFQFY